MKNVRKKHPPLLKIKGECNLRLDAKELLLIVTAIIIITACASDSELIVSIIDYIINNVISQYL